MSEKNMKKHNRPNAVRRDLPEDYSLRRRPKRHGGKPVTATKNPIPRKRRRLMSKRKVAVQGGGVGW